MFRCPAPSFSIRIVCMPLKDCEPGFTLDFKRITNQSRGFIIPGVHLFPSSQNALRCILSGSRSKRMVDVNSNCSAGISHLPEYSDHLWRYGQFRE